MPYIGVSPFNGVRKKHTYTATASQTSFSGAGAEGITLSYKDSTFVDVFQNGVKLGEADYTSTSGTSIVLGTGASLNDIVEVVVYDVFSVADTVSKADGGTFDGAVTLAGGVSGSTTFDAGATITTADNNPQLILKSTDADATEGPIIDMIRDSSSPADSDKIGAIRFKSDNDAGEEVTGVTVLAKVKDASDGTEDGVLQINTLVNGTEQIMVNVAANETVFNEDGADIDFRVEGDTDTNALVVDASADRVGIGESAPASKLEITAGVNSHGLLRLNDSDAGNLGGYMQFDSNGTNKANVQNANNAGIHLCVGTGGSVVFTQLGYTAANALDDYEEGTWTAVLTGSSSNPSSTVQTTGARYTKVGRFVFAQALYSNVNTSGASGAPRVTGLPFAAASSYATGNVMLHTGFNVGGGVVNVSPFVSTTQVQFYQSVSAGAWAEIAHNATSGVYLYFTVTYEV